MRERITYIVRNPSEFHPKQLGTSKASFAVNSLDAIKEQSITLSTKEIPPALWRVLRNCHELHIRWSGAQPYHTLAPFVSRVPPGLHVHFTPLEGRSAKRLCELLKDSFGQNIKCSNVKDAFTTPPILSERFSNSAARQFYHFTPSLLDLSLYIQQTICGGENFPCRLAAHDLKKADTFDIDFDAVSRVLTLKAVFTTANGDDGKWYEELIKGSGDGDTLEVGVLMSEEATEEEELRFSGFLTQAGRDDEPKPTLFSTASRHHPLSSPHSLAYKASFQTPTGIHPTLALSFSSTPTPPAQGCALHAYFTLPSTLFFDKYPFSDPLFLASHSLRAMHAISGATDLEAPEWVVPTWGSAALFELATPNLEQSSEKFEATFPLHLRYLPPFNASTILTPVPWPTVFWACPAEKGSKYNTSPFDRTNLGYDGLFGTNTLFYHVPPSQEVSRIVETLSVPVLDLQKATSVEMGTIITVLGGTLWVLYILLGSLWKNGYSRTTQSKSKKAE